MNRKRCLNVRLQELLLHSVNKTLSTRTEFPKGSACTKTKLTHASVRV